MLEPSDAELVRAFQNGDQVAFTRFAARHQDRVYRMAIVWLYDPSLAADVLQETLLRSYTGLGKFRFRANPSTWLLRVCRNVCHEENRRSARTQSLPEDYDAPAEEVDGAAVDFSGVLNKVNELAPRQREVVILRMFEELSVADTARVMGCRPGTVKAHLNKALNALRKLMDGGTRRDG